MYAFVCIDESYLHMNGYESWVRHPVRIRVANRREKSEMRVTQQMSARQCNWYNVRQYQTSVAEFLYAKAANSSMPSYDIEDARLQHARFLKAWPGFSFLIAYSIEREGERGIKGTEK